MMVHDGTTVVYPRNVKVFSPTGVRIGYLVRLNTDTGEAVAAIPSSILAGPGFLDEINRMDPDYKVTPGELGVEIVHFTCKKMRIEID